MQLRDIWPDDPVFVEVGVPNADVALGLRQAGYTRYLGVSGDVTLLSRMQRVHREVADKLLHSPRRKLVSNNNAEVLILSGSKTFAVWKYRSVRHARWVAWRAGFNLWSFAAWLGCICQMLSKRYTRPQVVKMELPGG